MLVLLLDLHLFYADPVAAGDDPSFRPDILLEQVGGILHTVTS